MSKRSAVSTRDTAAGHVTGAGGLVVHAGTVTVDTSDRVELVDLTDRIVELARRSGIREGLVSVWSMHTTCSVFINETQRALHSDIKLFLEKAVERDAEWLHNDPEHSDCDRMNADAHLRAMLLGHGLTLQVSEGEIVLGQWQRILLAELDGPRARTVRVQLLGMG